MLTAAMPHSSSIPQFNTFTSNRAVSVLLVPALLCQCGEKKETVPASYAVVVPAPAPVSTPASTPKAEEGWTDWLKAQWNKRDEHAAKVSSAIDSIKMPELGKGIASLQKAIETQDLPKVEELAKAIDKTLSTQNLDNAVGFIMLQRRQGGEAAAKAIEDYAKRPDLNSNERAAADSFKKGLAFVQRDDVKSYIALAILFTCQSKFGSHEGAAVGALAVSLIYPDFGNEPKEQRSASAHSPLESPAAPTSNLKP